MRLFEEHETLRSVIDCALEGRLGRIHRDNPQAPRVARIDLGCYAIFSGDAAHPLAESWVGALVPPVEILLPGDQAWRDLVDRRLGERCSDRPMRTFASHDLDPESLRAASRSVPEGYRVAAFDLPLARQIDADLTPHALSTFPSAEMLIESGLGYAVVAPDGSLAAQSSSYAISSTSVEIAVSTRPAFRRRGLARAAAAAMVLACLERGLRPDWSAANPVSKRLARSLGFRPADLCDILFYE